MSAGRDGRKRKSLFRLDFSAGFVCGESVYFMVEISLQAFLV